MVDEEFWFQFAKLAIIVLDCWLQIHPDLYEADEIGILLETLGLLHPCTWSPTDYVLEIIREIIVRSPETNLGDIVILNSLDSNK